jgi:ubiquinone/menaquinone biosynthesis C-methylase UbiE
MARSCWASYRSARSSGARSGRASKTGGAGIRHGVRPRVLRTQIDRIDKHRNPSDGSRFYRDATEIEEHTVSQIDSTREPLIETYRKKAKHYDITSRLYPVPGYPQRAQRLRAVQALGLRPGDSVVEIACGTGLNFSLIEQVIGPDGRIVGVDLTDAMLAQAQHRIEANGWSNISLVQADAAEFDFPTEVDAILSTYALSHVPESGDVIAHGAAALSPGGRWVVLDLKLPDNAPRWLAQLGIALGRPFGSIEEWIARRPWEAIRAAVQNGLTDPSWTELFFGTAFLAVGSRGSRRVDKPPQDGDH